MSITSKIICDSLHPSGSRLTTFVLTYPRFIHCEIMTHRALSKNSASSRAIPFTRMVRMVETDTARPEYWGAEQAGMQSGGEIDNPAQAEDLWLAAGAEAVMYAENFRRETGAHKSICNRMLEPYAHMTIILTGEARGLAHFFALRAHPMAQPEFQVLAYRMLRDYLASRPQKLQIGEWHVPFDELGYDLPRRLMIATGRCARVSYLTHEGTRDPNKDVELHDKLLDGDPPHMSPFEHCAEACEKMNGANPSIGLRRGYMKNFGPHWIQYRCSVHNEFTETVDYDQIMRDKPEWITL